MVLGVLKPALFTVGLRQLCITVFGNTPFYSVRKH